MQATIHDIERLFGTSDLKALEQIAKQWASADANPRGAGRKKKFTLDEVVTMKVMQQDGTTEAQLAKQYKTSRQTISTNFRRLYDFSEHPTAGQPYLLYAREEPLHRDRRGSSEREGVCKKLHRKTAADGLWQKERTDLAGKLSVVPDRTLFPTEPGAQPPDFARYGA